jgi:hypothetical protein
MVEEVAKLPRVPDPSAVFVCSMKPNRSKSARSPLALSVPGACAFVIRAQVNVALSPPEAFSGGALLALCGDALVEVSDRPQGSAVVHLGSVCHAVSPVTAGTRYGMVIFLDDAVSGNSQADETPTSMCLRLLHQQKKGGGNRVDMMRRRANP